MAHHLALMIVVQKIIKLLIQEYIPILTSCATA